jgi:flavodoxin
MKRALVIYESMFGNTHSVADAVAAGLGTALDVSVVEVSHAPRQISDDIDLVVVGGPTHAFSMSRPSTRQSASDQGADPEAAGHDGIREWIGAVTAPEGLLTAAFDTKVLKPHLPGSAAKSAGRKLRHRGFKKIDDPKTFYVTGTKGDLVDGEVDRARQWGTHLAQHWVLAAH